MKRSIQDEVGTLGHASLTAHAEKEGKAPVKMTVYIPWSFVSVDDVPGVIRLLQKGVDRAHELAKELEKP